MTIEGSVNGESRSRSRRITTVIYEVEAQNGHKGRELIVFPAGNVHDDRNHDDEQEAEGDELKGVPSDGVVSVIVECEREAGHTSFDVEVTGVQPDAMRDMALNTVVVLTITLDSTGGGEFEFNRAPDDGGEQSLPAESPILSAGDVVAVGDLNVPLEVEEDD